MDKYIIEYSIDGIRYSTAGEVISVNNTSRHTYTYQHAIVNATTIYYRLKMGELDGTFEYSPVISIGPDTKTGIRVYPSTVTNGKVNIISWQPVERILVTNISGQQVLSKKMNGMTGYFTIEIPFLQKGIYIIRIAGERFSKDGKNSDPIKK